MPINLFVVNIQILRFVNHARVDKNDGLCKIKPIIKIISVNIRKISNFIRRIHDTETWEIGCCSDDILLINVT